MKTIITAIIITFSFNSWAVFQQIWKGYQVSNLNQSNHLDIKLNEANFTFDSNKFDWKLEITPAHENSNLDSNFSFQANRTIKNSMTYGLSKPTYKWGTFSIKHSQITYDLSDWPKSSGQPLDEMFETKNIVSYTYDFLDRSQDKDYELIHLNKSKGDIQSKLTIDKGYFDFFTVYLQAKLQVYSVELTKEFVKRSQKRVSQVQKRVRDGLSRRVELNQAKSSLINQQEALERSRSSLKQNLAILENILGKEIDESFFEKLTWKSQKFSYWSKNIQTQKHYSYDVLEQSLEYSEKMIEKIADQNGYKLLLSATYVSNDIDESSSESLSNSLAGERDSKNISLNIVIPLGGDKGEGLRTKYAYQKKKNELDLLTKKDELKSKKEALIQQIKYLERATGLSIKKVGLARDILKEQNRLYLRGQASFEEVIRAEESYINAELSEKRLFAEYETLIANYAFFNNSIKAVLDVYQD